MKKIIVFALSLVIVIISVSCACQDEVKLSLQGLTSEVDVLPPYVRYSELYVSDKILDFDRIIKSHSKDGDFRELFAIVDDVAWILFIEDAEGKGTLIWNIASVNLSNEQFILHYSNLFTTSYVCNRNVQNTKDYFCNINGYYRDGIIVLTDHVKVIEYNIKTKKFDEFLSEEYSFPQLPIYATIDNVNKKIYFVRQGEEKTLDFVEMQDKVKAFEIIAKFDQSKTWLGSPYLEYLFDNVQICDEIIYITCRILNYTGHTYAMVFEYDFDTNSCKYVFSNYMDDVINRRLYIVTQE